MPALRPASARGWATFGPELQQKAQEKMAEMNATTQETLSVVGALLTKTSGRAELTGGRASRARTRALTELADPPPDDRMRYFFTLIGLTFSHHPRARLLAGRLADRGTATGTSTVGTIVAFTSLQARLFFPLTSLLNVQVEVISALALFDRIFEYLDLPLEIHETRRTRGPRPAPGARRGPLSTTSSSATTPDAPEPTLDGITFTARPGELVALVGPPARARRRLTYLMPRLYDVDERPGARSTATTCGTSTLASRWAACVGMVTQETYLVHDTIRENLRYGKPGRHRRRVWRPPRGRRHPRPHRLACRRATTPSSASAATPVRRREAARRHRPRPAQGPAHPDPGRGDQRPGHAPASA